jgi:hypothetical protein
MMKKLLKNGVQEQKDQHALVDHQALQKGQASSFEMISVSFLQ